MNIIPTFKRLAVALALATAACAGPAGSGSSGVSVVASTNVWGDVARQVVGRVEGHGATVKSIITDPSADPHAYEVTTRDELAISRADVIVENGGGYDDFVGRMRSASGANGTVLDAVRISGRQPVGGELNEHVWYDLRAAIAVAQRLAGVLAQQDPAHAATYRANARTFAAHVEQLRAQEAALAVRFRGDGVAITEPVPLYMLQACGLVNRTPEEFSKAIEDEQDVAVRVLQQVRDLFAQHRVRLLVYNAQTSGPQTNQVIAAAKSAGVPVVPVTETLPAHTDYVNWMSANLAAVAKALETS